MVRSPFPRLYLLVVALAGFTLFSSVIVFGTQHRERLGNLVPTISWERTSADRTSIQVAAELPREPQPQPQLQLQSQSPPQQCAGKGLLLEIERKWGRAALRMSVAHGGSGARLQRVLRRFREQKKIVIGAVGGSISFGHSLQEGEKRWTELLQEGLQSVYPDAEVSMNNGAVPATGTDYFAHCYEQHVPRDSDLFIIETAVNDLINEYVEGADGREHGVVDHTEQLVRHMRSSPSNPAVMMLSTWAVTYDYMSGADRHAVVSEYYDIPRISMRSFLYPYLSQNQDEIPKFFGSKVPDHPVKAGHEYMADILLHYILTQDCLDEEMDDIEPYPELGGSELNTTLDAYTLPPLRIKQHLDQEPYPEPHPVCVSANVRLEGDVSQLQPSSHSGWEETTHNDKHYWTSTRPGARITFSDIEVNNGKLSIYYLRSNSLGLGNMRCWANNDEDHGVVLKGWWYFVNAGSVGLVADGLARGKHSVTCVVKGELEEHNGLKGTHRVSIIAVLAS